MPTTGKGYPYPAATDTPDVPRDIQALAAFTDAKVPYAMAAGTVNVPVNNTAAATAAVTFPVGRFSPTVSPVVAHSVNDGANANLRATRMQGLVSASGFGVLLDFTAASTIAGGVWVGWIAVQMLTNSSQG